MFVANSQKAEVRIHEIGLANPNTRFLQKDIPQLLGITNHKLKKFFEHEHIQSRHLFLPANIKKLKNESNHALLERFIQGALVLTEKAIKNCLAKTDYHSNDIDFICCVTSTGFIVPSLSARFIKQFRLRDDCQRVDIVGMGCSAGLNGLNAVTNWCSVNPKKNALLICVEICSAIYTANNTLNTALVNSLFGDGVAVALLRNEQGTKTFAEKPRILDFESQLLPEHSEALRFEWDKEKNCYSFYVSKNTPTVLSAVVEQPLRRLLQRNAIKKEDLKYWVLHGGGDAILNAMRDKLNINDNDLKYTRSILRECGNLSSASFLFSFNRLLTAQTMQSGELALLMTMGPGLAIEMALVGW